MRSSCSKNCCISIHAPTRGATNGENRYKRIKQFQSTLPRGERQSHHFLLSSSFSYFNPRSHEGSDSDLVMNIYNRNHFNPRSHEGSDASASSPLLWYNIFQSTLPRGERRISYALHMAIINFNPRSHEGSDQTTTAQSSRIHHFNPRSHEGSDANAAKLGRYLMISIHAPTRGATQCVCVVPIIPDISIHAPTRGATQRGKIFYSLRRFQSTLPRGERQQFSPKSSLFSQQKLSKIFNLNNKLF